VNFVGRRSLVDANESESESGSRKDKCYASEHYTNRARDEPLRVTSHPTIPTLRVVPSSTRHNSTTMTVIQEAIKYIKSREARDKFLYR
jgi:hypothetical protein